ncbi:MAG: transcriptional repressor [Corallococcus sp.]|nr:transcriptional repressor [Bacillota bacterium]MCM1533151.1 transcriptional repressor [Corallococcus sp.]
MRFSSQREAVYKVLSQTDSHPDITWIYGKTREIIPNVSLATVYRNLDELCSVGRVKRISVEGVTERYDARVEEHAHKVCSRCGRIEDVLPSDINVQHSLADVDRYEVTFYGCCDECRTKINKEKNK